MNLSRGTELKVGIFVTLGLGLIMVAILALGGQSSLFSRRNSYTAHFPQADGLYVGAKVVLGGVNVGTVENVDLDTENKEVKATLRVKKKYETFIRKGSEAEILTQGVLGDKYISITIGPDGGAILPSESELPIRPTRNLTEVLSKSDQLVNNLTSLAGSLDRVIKRFEEESTRGALFKNLNTAAAQMAHASGRLSSELDDLQSKKTSRHLSQIIEKINNGTGTLGALVNDPGLYDDVKALLGGANRNRIVRNLVRKTVRENEEAEAAKKD
jgi:phospholipid/cholesterol/gamma-HCH transport system substrate-binding protein